VRVHKGREKFNNLSTGFQKSWDAAQILIKQNAVNCKSVKLRKM